jgi:hypothetical protein
MIKHLLHWLFFAFTMFAAGAPAVGGGDGGTGSGTGAPAAGSGGGAADAGGGQPAAGSQAGAGAPSNQDNIRQLRENYEGLKTKYEPWEKLGVQPNQVTQFQTIYTKVYNEAASIGRELGYPDDEIAEALAEDPVRTIDFLRNEASRAQQGQDRQDDGQDLNALVSQHVQQALSPIQQRENQRMTSEANSLFERTVHQLASESFKGEGIDVANIPQDEMYLLVSATSEIMKYDADALKALKYEGKTAAVQKAFQEARTMLDKYYLARAGRDKARVQPSRPGQPAQPQNQGGRRPTLDEMIEDPSRINQKYA